MLAVSDIIKKTIRNTIKMKKSQKEEVIEFANKKYHTQAEYLWISAPTYAVLRHNCGKWYGIIMDIKANKIGINSEEIVDVLVCKCNAELKDMLLEQKGFYPAYHMNKEKWITILLDYSVDIELIKHILQLSYETFEKSPKKTKNKK